MSPTDITNRHACGLYVDLRLGVIGSKPMAPDEAQHATARVYGLPAASYAREMCN